MAVSLAQIQYTQVIGTSKSSIDDKDFHKFESEIVFLKACSAATWISASLIGRSIDPSKFPGVELVRGMDDAGALLGVFANTETSELLTIKIILKFYLEQERAKHLSSKIRLQNNLQLYRSSMRYEARQTQLNRL